MEFKCNSLTEEETARDEEMHEQTVLLFKKQTHLRSRRNQLLARKLIGWQVLI